MDTPLDGRRFAMTLRLGLDPPERPRVLALKTGRLGDWECRPVGCIADVTRVESIRTPVRRLATRRADYFA